MRYCPWARLLSDITDIFTTDSYFKVYGLMTHSCGRDRESSSSASGYRMGFRAVYRVRKNSNGPCILRCATLHPP